MKFFFIGKLPVTTDTKENYKKLIKLCHEKKVPLTKEIQKWAKKNMPDLKC